LHFLSQKAASRNPETGNYENAKAKIRQLGFPFSISFWREKGAGFSEIKEN